MSKSNTVIKSAAKNKGGSDEPVVDPVLATPEPQPAPVPVAVAVTATAPAPAPAEQIDLLTTPPSADTPSDGTTSSEPAPSSVDGGSTLDLSGGELPQPAIDQPVIDQPVLEQPAIDQIVVELPVGEAPPPVDLEPAIVSAEPGTSPDPIAGDLGSADPAVTDAGMASASGAPAADTPVVDYSVLQTTNDYSASTAAPGAHYGVVADATAAARAVLAADSGIQLVADSARLNAASSAVGLYDGQVADVGIGQGLVLTSGTLGGFTNTISGFGQSNTRNGDDGLNQVVNTVFSTYSYDASVLEFKFTLADGVDANSVSFDLVFGSDEFPEWVNSYVDTAAVWVNGTNYALFNHSEYNPLSVVSQNVDAGYFRDNTAAQLSTEYDGISEMLRITAPIVAGVNTIRIAIADTGDTVLDSAIYLANMKAGTSSGSGVTAVDDQGTSGDDSAEGTEKAEYFDLSYGDDSLNAGLGDDLIDSGDGNDDIAGDAGNDAINGGAGDDSARYHGNSSEFTVTLLDSGSYQVVDNRPDSPDGTDILDGVEKLHFDDGTFAIESLLDPATTTDTGAASASTDQGNTAPTTADTPVSDPAVSDPAVTDPATTDTVATEPAPVDTPPAAPADGVTPPIDAGATDTPAPAADPVADPAVDAAADPVVDQVADPVASDADIGTAPVLQDEPAVQDQPVDTLPVADPAPAESVPEQPAAQADTQTAAPLDAPATENAQPLPAGLTLTGSADDDKLVGGSGSDTLNGGAGSDTMNGGAGNDSYYVDDKKDVVSETADGGIDTVYASTKATLSAYVENLTLIGSGSDDGTGNTLDNILIGNGARNVLAGGAGNDTIQGGGGIDQLTGGSGNDYFVFSSTADSEVGLKHDVITDFSQGDLIDLSQIDAIIGTSTDDAFSYIGTEAYSGVAGQLQFDASTGNLSGDVNGDGAADFEINLAGVGAAPSYASFQF